MAIYTRNPQGQFVPLNIPTLKGEKGKDGVAPNFTIGNVTTLPSGQQATVTIRGDKENPIIDFGIPKGQDGTITYYDEVLQVGELKFLAFDKGESFELNGHTWVKCEGQAVASAEYGELYNEIGLHFTEGENVSIQPVTEDGSEVSVDFNLPTNNSPVGYTYICAK